MLRPRATTWAVSSGCSSRVKLLGTAHNAEPCLSRRSRAPSTIGTVSVTRELARVLVTDMKVGVPAQARAAGSCKLTKGAGNTVVDFTNEFSSTDSIWVAGTRYTVKSGGVTSNDVTLNERVTNTNALSDIPVYKWANGYAWTITFAAGHVGDVPELVPSTSNNWRGTSPTLTVRTVRHGLQPLSGTFRVALRTAAGLSMTTPPLAHDVSAADMQAALSQLVTAGPVAVQREVNGYGHNWRVTFWSELGDVEDMVADSNSPAARARR